MPENSPTLIDAARGYIERGWRPVPVPHASKAPKLKGWQRLRIEAADLRLHFNGVHSGGNIGIILGEPSGHLVDVDLDCPEARELAAEFLPPTDARTGRPGAPSSHWWYIAPGARTQRHSDPVDRGAIVELRSTGAQTLVGPSVHPSGERYDPLEGEPAVVDADTLAACVASLARAVVERRHGRKVTVLSQSPALGKDRLPADDDVLRRAAAYLDAMPPAISGQGGHNRAYAAATAMVHGFGLDAEAALRLLLDRYNPRCLPPWSEKELRHKVDDASTKPHTKPHGWLRDSGNRADDDVDLSGIEGDGVGPEGSVGSVSCQFRQASGQSEDPGPIPERLLRPPGFIGEVIDFNLATATRPQPVLALAAAICLQAVLAARKVRDERGNRTNLYCVGVAPSGAGKDHARKVNKNILFASGLVEHEGNEDLASDAGLVAAVEAEPAILFQIDEFGRFLRTIGDPRKAPHLYNVLTALMKLYSSADTVFRGKAYADRNRNKVIDQPCVCVYGTTVPEHFFESLTADSLADGFVARLLVFETPASAPPRIRTPQRSVPEAILESARWWGDFQPGGNMRIEHPEPVVVPTTPEGGAVFDHLAAMVDDRLADEGNAGRALWARAEEKACRLALIHACSSNRQNPVIDEAAAGWACDLSEHLTRRMLHVCGEWVADGQFDARQKRVLRIVRRADGKISRSDLCRRTQWLTQRERQEVIDNLIETGQLREEREATATKPRVVYALV
ncbi:MAG: DUF3987 domain-containing protein [Phycisphaeraceae bacterium]|nr:MAG: DUF3987 domain-containing protein [Phycisphaeraceae bacterium]